MNQSSPSPKKSNLMIRRIVESLRTRSFSIFATELIIVNVAVFIGLQVPNWNDAKMEHQQWNKAGAPMSPVIEGYGCPDFHLAQSLKFSVTMVKN